MYFLPKGQRPGNASLSKVARQLHLAFKAMETEEVYDVLMEHLISSIKGYDPNYKAKVKLAVGIIDHEFSQRKQFNSADLNRHLDIDSHRDLKLLGRLGFLRKEAGAEKVANYCSTGSWPRPWEFFKGSPIGPDGGQGSR
jgi:hypothetical protein